MSKVADTPAVSVIMPVYNTGDMVRTTIESVLAQTFSDFEFIIIDDGSRAETSEIVRSYTDPRIRYCYQENQGMASARNRGIELAQGQYLAFLDHDDIWLPEKLDEQLKIFAAYPETMLVYSQVEFFNDRRSWLQDEPILNGQVFISLLRSCVIHSTSCVMVPRTALFNSALRFHPDSVPCDDYELWLRIALLGAVRCTEKVLVRYRLHDHNISRQHNLMTAKRLHVIRQMFSVVRSSSISGWRKLRLNWEICRTLSWLYRHLAEGAVHSPDAVSYARQALYYGWFNPKSFYVWLKVIGSHFGSSSHE